MIDMSKLKKSSHDRWITGVCGGIAEHFGLSSTLVRILFVIFSSAGFWVYLVLMFMLEDEITSS